MRSDRLTRGLYSTDASIYQIMPLAVGFPSSRADVRSAIEVAGEAGVPVVPRGAGTSMSGQCIGRGLVLDTSRHLHGIRDFDPANRRIVVEPGMVLDDLNRFLEPHGLFFPIDVATSSRATIGGMAGNNSAGARSIRYGHMVEHVRGIEAILADGTVAWFGPSAGGSVEAETAAGPVPVALQTALQSLYARESEELARRLPAVPRHVAGYALHRLGRPGATLADVLVGSEGTLAFFTAVELRLHELPAARALGVCRFESVRAALAAVPHIVELEPTAVELLDRTLLELAESIPSVRPALRTALGRSDADDDIPGGALIVEFADDDPDRVEELLTELEQVAAAADGGTLAARDTSLQKAIWEARKAGLNIATSMVEPRKPIAFIEDCAIPIDRLVEWHERLGSVIERHGTRAIWYAHASVGCLHVRPALDLKDPGDVRRMREIAREAFALASELGGTHSGEHGDGIVRSEFIEPMLGRRLADAFREVKSHFDPAGLLNPGKVVEAPAMDDRSLFRYSPDYRPESGDTALDWSKWGDWVGAVEMCNNNGACRKRWDGAMCPSFRATDDERHSTRGRANALRLALSGRLGEDPWASPDLHEAMDLCIGCKACRRECPTGVDMSRMKIEYLRRYRASHGLSLRDRAIAWLPRLARWISHVPNFANARNRAGPLARVVDRGLGLAPDRPLPRWAGRPFQRSRALSGLQGARVAPSRGGPGATDPGSRATVFVDTFTRYFEPENAYAAIRVLTAAGYRVQIPRAGRPACCGRTFLNSGLVDEARTELTRLVALYAPHARRGTPIVGLEPSCLLTLRDELPALLPDDPDARLIAEHARLFTELLIEDGIDRLPLTALPDAGRALVHGHCHSKAFGLADSVPAALARIPDLDVAPIAAGCCGMAGSFGYEAEHADVSRRIGELELAPAVRAAGEETAIVAEGTSCRHQIRDLTGREALHPARLLDAALG